jgi:hypothetical protein
VTLPQDLEPILSDLRVGLARRARRRRRNRGAAATVIASAAAVAFALNAPIGGSTDGLAPAPVANHCASALEPALPDYSTTLSACS